MTTTQLAKKFGVKVPTIHKAYFKDGHYRGYVPIGFDAPVKSKRGVRQYTWGLPDERTA